MAKSDLRNGTTWIPRGLSREEAAYYIGVGASKFDQLVADGRMPKPIRVDGRVIWDRIKIDMAFSDLGEVRENMIDAAIRKSQRSQEVSATEGANSEPGTNTSKFAGTPGEQGPSGWPLPATSGDHLDRWYSKLGFDPATMSSDDMHRLQDEAHARWKAQFVHTPLGKRERDTLRQFEGVEPGHLVTFNWIKGLGINTAECLEARGFIEIRYRANDPNRLEGWVLTAEGKEASRAILADQEPQRPAN